MGARLTLAGAFVVGAACQPPPAAAPEPSRPAPAASSARVPDGVVLDAPASVPAVQVRAPARGVITLREPVADEAVRKLVGDLVSAFQREDLAALRALLTSDAGLLSGRARAERADLVPSWARRLSQLDFKKLAGVELVRLEKVVRYEFEDLSDRDEPARPNEMVPGDVLVRFPMEVTKIGDERFFGQTLTLLLRREDGRCKIAGYAESEP